MKRFFLFFSLVCFVLVSHGSAQVVFQGPPVIFDTGESTLEDVIIGDTLDGTVNVINTGDFRTRTTYLGYNPSVNGTGNVIGASARFATSDQFFVGYEGKGILNINSGGLVISQGESFVGNEVGSVGVINVNGFGSEWQTQDYLVIGAERQGMMNIMAGGRVTSAGVSVIGSNWGYGAPPSLSEVTVTGSGSTWTTMELRVGSMNDARMNIYQGGTVSSDGDCSVGTSGSTFGYADIRDAGSAWNLSERLMIGNTGKGRVFVHNAGLLNSSSTIQVSGAFMPWMIGGRGRLDVENGTIQAETIQGSRSSMGKFNNLGTGSTITVSGGYNPDDDLYTYFYVDSTPTGTSPINATGGTVNLSGTSYVAAYGMAVQKADNTFDLFHATCDATYSNTFSAPEMKVVSGGDPDTNGTLTVGFDEGAYRTWNIHNQPCFFASEDMELYGTSCMGWVKVETQPNDGSIQAYFNYNGGTLSDRADSNSM